MVLKLFGKEVLRRILKPMTYRHWVWTDLKKNKVKFLVSFGI